MTKTCSRCKDTKPVTAFSLSRREKDGLRDWCKACEKEHRENHLDEHKARAAAYYQAHKAEVKARTSAWSKAHPECARKRKLKRKYGLTVVGYEALLRAQNGGCAICGSTTSVAPGGTLAVDHDHETGKIRGILCHHCNVGLGSFRDSLELLLNAAIYLEKNRGG